MNRVSTTSIDVEFDADEPTVPWRRLWFLSLTIATLLGAWTAAFVYFGMIVSGKPLTLLTAVLAGLPDWYFWACLTPPVFWLGIRYRVTREAWPRALAVHIPAGVITVLAELLLFTTFNHFFYYNPWAPAPADFSDAYLRDVLRSFHYGFLIYCVIVAAAQSFSFYRDYQVRAKQALRLKRQNADLESLLAKTQLDVLRAQLHPHFLFNAFNTISGLIRDGRSAEATDMVAHLGQLFRLTLKSTDRNTIPLSEELELTEAYVAIERVRFHGHLDVYFDIPEELLDCTVPSMFLQPLVENAIRHGLDGRNAGWVAVRASRVECGVRIDVEDSGTRTRSLGATEGSGFRIGLSNLVSRLERLYGSDYEFGLGPTAHGGTCASIRVPFASRHELALLAS
jgi:hypothetical protein